MVDPNGVDLNDILRIFTLIKQVSDGTCHLGNASGSDVVKSTISEKNFF